jgi:hypothetical protein
MNHGQRAIPGQNAVARLAGLLAVCGVALQAGGARAADAAASSATDAETLETITVSARKRDESLATVPVSITVFTSESLEKYNIQSFNDYATKTPNVSFSYGGGPTGIADARTVAIRGITGQNLYGTAGATGFYIDDTPVPGSVDPRVLDIDNIEVLKGPQTLLHAGLHTGSSFQCSTARLRRLGPTLARPQVHRTRLVVHLLDQFFLSPHGGYRGLHLRHAASPRKLLLQRQRSSEPTLSLGRRALPQSDHRRDARFVRPDPRFQRHRRRFLLTDTHEVLHPADPRQRSDGRYGGDAHGSGPSLAER